MNRIVTTSYRYKRPPRKRKAVTLEVPAITPGKGRAGNDNRASASIVQTKSRKDSKGGGWADDGAPPDPAMREVIVRLMRGRPSDD